MAAPQVLVILEKDLTAGWTWVQTEAADVWGLVQPLLSQALHNFESTVLQQIMGAAAAVLKAIGTAVKGVPIGDVETTILNVLSALGGSLLSAAQSIGSTVLQAIITMLIAKL